MNRKTIPNFETRQIRLNQSVQFVNRIKAEYKGTPINHRMIPLGTGKEDIEKNPIMRMLPIPVVRCMNDQVQLWGENKWRALPEFLIEFHKWYKAGLYPELIKGYTPQPFNDGQYRAKKKRGIVVNAVGCGGGWIQVRQIYSDVTWMIPRTIFDELYMPEK